MLSADKILAADGALAEYISGFEARESQQEMAAAIETAIQNKESLVVEAGTGTGKTFAYLLPALLSDKKVIISTGTKNLQDQLFLRDLPLLIKALKLPIKKALLKGRANYLCLYRLEQAQHSEDLFYTKSALADLQLIKQQAIGSRHGDISEITGVAEDSPVWYSVTSSVDNCLGKECDFYNDCHLIKARRRAMDAQLLVVNHHLFFASQSLKADERSELLPKADVIIFDEAHQLAEIASQFFGQRISSRQISDLTQDVELACEKVAPDMQQLRSALLRLEKSSDELRDALGETGQRAAWHSLTNKKQIAEISEQLQEEFEFVDGCLQEAAQRSKELQLCWERCAQLRASFQRLTESVEVDEVHWFETFRRTFAIYLTPINIAEHFQALMQERPASWIFTSATLTVGDQFTHFVEELGLQDIACQLFASPFDYKSQALLYLPRELPDPKVKDFSEQVLALALPVIKAAQGRTFFLFTSYRALNIVAEELPKHVDYPLLVQGTQSKDQLLRRYRELGNAVLLGTMSFWEGVDVRGAALSCVIIDKLPFSFPDDPVMQAKSLALRKAGKDPFYEMQVPQAAILLKQGVGRLIRDSQDKGILMLADPRIIAREYGKLFLKSLPPMQRTRDIDKVTEFELLPVEEDETISY